MSINSLLSPNNYRLFAQDITADVYADIAGIGELSVTGTIVAQNINANVVTANSFVGPLDPVGWQSGADAVTITRIGTTATTNASGQIAILGQASGTGAVALGEQSVAGSGAATNSLAVGSQASATGGADIAIGREASCTGAGGTCVGYLSSVTTTGGSAFGRSAVASEIASTAIGREASAAGSASTSIGYLSSAAGQSAVALGRGTSAPLAGDISLGAFAGNTNVAGTGVVRLASIPVPAIAAAKASTHQVPITINGVVYNFLVSDV